MSALSEVGRYKRAAHLPFVAPVPMNRSHSD